MTTLSTYEQYQIVSSYDPEKIKAAGLMPQGIKNLGDVYREQSRLFALLSPAEKMQDEKAVNAALNRISRVTH